MVDRVTQSPSRIPVPIKSPSRSVNGKFLPYIDHDDRPKEKENHLKTSNENGLLEKLDIEMAKSKPKKPGKEAGFETFVMTGDMIIQTSRKQELVKNLLSPTKIPSPNKDMFFDARNIVEPKPSISQEFDKSLVNEFKSDGLASVDQRSAESGFVEDQGQISDSGTIERKQSKTRDQSSVSDLSEVSLEEITDMSESHVSNTSNLSGEMVQSQISALSSLSSDTSKSQISTTSNLSDISLSSDLKSDTSEQTIFRQDIGQSGPYNSVSDENYYSASLCDDREISSLPWDINQNSEHYGHVDSPCMSDTGEMTEEDRRHTSAIIATSKSAEKIGMCHNGHLVVRPSKSHENYLQSGTEFALVQIDIDDNMTFSLDQIPQHADSLSSSLEKMVDDSPQLSRSLQNSPERKADKSADRVFMPGFISLEEPRIIRAKCKDNQQSRVDTFENNSTETSDLSESGDTAEQYRRHELSVLDENMTHERTSYQSDLHTFGTTINLPSEHSNSMAMEMAVGRGSELPNQLFDVDYDADSLYHQPNKSVDRPSAQRLAKRLYNMSGFRKSDVCRHLCKKNDFSNMVAEEYLKLFNFAGDSLDTALRKFLKQFSLIGETQERERVLAHFSRHYMECNLGSYNSEDACHTLTCAIMLLNTDLHGQNIGRKMTCAEFVENLSELNDGDNFPREVLKAIYNGIKSEPIEWAVDEEFEEGDSQVEDKSPAPIRNYVTNNPFLDLPDSTKAKEYKKGYVMRKCCVDADGKRTSFGKRSWKMFYAVLWDMIIYLYKDEHTVKKKGHIQSSHNLIRIHHALASKATDYKKKQHVLRLQTADIAEYLFQTSDSKELQDWIDAINLVAATLSAPPLPGAVGSQKRFQRPLLPASHTRLSLKDQMQHNEDRVNHLEHELYEHRIYPPEKGAKARIIQDFMEKGTYLEHELKRFRTYAYLLQSHLTAHPDYEPSLVETAIGEDEESAPGADTQNFSDLGLPRPLHRSLSDRYSYRAAIYQTDQTHFMII